MTTSFGRTVRDQTGRPIQVAVDDSTEWKSGGVTVDWDAVTAATADATLADDTPIKEGEKYLPMGQVLVKDGDTYRPGADTDTLARGETFIVNRTVRSTDLAANHLGVIEGGRVYEARLQVGGAGQPTLAGLIAVMPRLVAVND